MSYENHQTTPTSSDLSLTKTKNTPGTVDVNDDDVEAELMAKVQAIIGRDISAVSVGSTSMGADSFLRKINFSSAGSTSNTLQSKEEESTIKSRSSRKSTSSETRSKASQQSSTKKRRSFFSKRRSSKQTVPPPSSASESAEGNPPVALTDGASNLDEHLTKIDLTTKIEKLSSVLDQVKSELDEESDLRQRKEKNVVKLAKELMERGRMLDERIAQMEEVEEVVSILESKLLVLQKQLHDQMVLNDTQMLEQKDKFERSVVELRENHLRISGAHGERVTEVMQNQTKQSDDLRQEIVKAKLESERLKKRLERKRNLVVTDRSFPLSSSTSGNINNRPTKKSRFFDVVVLIACLILAMSASLKFNLVPTDAICNTTGGKPISLCGSPVTAVSLAPFPPPAKPQAMNAIQQNRLAMAGEDISLSLSSPSARGRRRFLRMLRDKFKKNSNKGNTDSDALSSNVSDKKNKPKRIVGAFLRLFQKVKKAVNECVGDDTCLL